MKYALLALGGLCSGVAQAQDLIAAYHQALDSAPVMAQSRADLKAGQQAPALARAALLPSLNVSVQGKRSRESLEKIAPRYQNTSVVAADLSQTVFNYAALSQYRSAKISDQLADLAYRMQLQQLMVTVAGAYFDVLQKNEFYRVKQAQMRYVHHSLSRAKNAYEVGLGTQMDINEAQAKLDALKAQLLTAKNDIANAQQTLSNLTGHVPHSLKGLGSRLYIQAPIPNRKAPWADKTQQQAFAVQQARLRRDQASMAYRAATGQRLPSVVVKADAARSTNVSVPLTQGVNVNSASVSLNLLMPVLQGGGLSAKSRQTWYQLDSARAGLEGAKREAKLQTSQAFLAVQNNIATVRALQQSVHSAEQALASDQAGFVAGTRTLLNVLDSQSRLTEQKQQFIAARYGYLLNMLRLKQSVSTLTEQDLRIINQHLVRTYKIT